MRPSRSAAVWPRRGIDDGSGVRAAASGRAAPSPSAALRAALHPGAAAPVGERLRAAAAAATALGDTGLAARLAAEQRAVEVR